MDITSSTTFKPYYAKTNLIAVVEAIQVLAWCNENQELNTYMHSK